MSKRRADISRAILSALRAKYPTISDGGLNLLILTGKRLGLDPVSTNQLWVSEEADRTTGELRAFVMVGIDGARAIAEGTGLYAGKDAARFNDNLTLFGAIQAGCSTPTTATVTVYRLSGGQRVPITAEVNWAARARYLDDESLDPYWKRDPFGKLAERAEMLALRQGFPKVMSGLYLPDEIAKEPKLEPKAKSAKRKAKEPPANLPVRPERNGKKVAAR